MLSRTLLLKMADSRSFRGVVESRGWRFASRFVAGRSLDEALDVVDRLSRRGIRSTLSHLGEHITDARAVSAESDVFREALDAIHTRNLPCGLSIKPSQLGLMIGRDLADRTFSEVLAHAATKERFVRVDMEDSTMTADILALTRSLHARFPRVGVVVQAYLHRSQADVNALNQEGVPVRLCKGAYMEPPDVALPDKRDVDRNYILLTNLLLHAGTRPAIATHDDTMIRETIRIVKEDLPRASDIAPRANADLSQWEFQMLYGVRRELQASLAGEGYGVRVYVPYGTEWFPYFMRRLAERPANIGFVVRNLLRR